MNQFLEILAPIADLLQKKNSDYGNSYDSTRNEFGPISLVLRLNDKISRLKTLLKQEAQVKDESIKDTLRDIIGYCVLELKYLDGEMENDAAHELKGAIEQFIAAVQQMPMERGYIIAYCETCGKDTGRYFLHQAVSHFNVKCTECGNVARLIRISPEEIKRLNEVSQDDGLCSLCLYRDLPLGTIQSLGFDFDPCDYCDGYENWEPKIDSNGRL